MVISDNRYRIKYKVLCLLSSIMSSYNTYKKGLQQDTIRTLYRISYEIIEFNRNETEYHRIP